MSVGNTTHAEREAAVALLEALNIPHDTRTPQGQEFIGHAETMAKAINVLWAKRGYGKSWRKRGFLGSLLKLELKVERLMNLLWWAQPGDVPTELADEDAGDTFVDIINYGVFGFQQWMAGEERGPKEQET